MKIELSNKTVHGTERGGEDVSLRVQITATRHPTREDVHEAFRQCLEEIPVLGEDEEGDLHGVYLKDGNLCTVESEYEFSVKEPLSKVVADVLQAHVDALDPTKPEWTPEWVQVLRSGVYKLELELYTNGNAE